MKQLPDDMLVRRVLAGDTDAFGPIVERYTDLGHAAIYEVLGDWDAVDGVAQDTFLAAYRSLGSLLQARACRGVAVPDRAQQGAVRGQDGSMAQADDDVGTPRGRGSV